MKISLKISLLLLLISPVLAQEDVEQATDVVASTSVKYRPARIIMDWKGADFQIRFEEIDANGFIEGGAVRTVQWTGNEAHALLRHLNTADLSSKSMVKRAIEKAQADGKLGSGTISGTPE